MNIPAMIMCGIGLTTAIFIGFRYKRNIGFICIAFSWIIGAFVLGLAPSEIIKYFPLTIIYRVLSVTFFFGFAIRNGTFKYIASMVMFKLRKLSWALPIGVFVVSFAMAGSGAGGGATTSFMSVLAMALAIQAGTRPIVYAAAVFAGSTAGTGFYFSSAGAVMLALLEKEPLYAEHAYSMTFSGFINQAIAHMIIFTIIYVAFKGWENDGSVDIEEPEPMNDKQKMTCVMILICFVLTFGPIFLNMALANSFTAYLKKCCDIQFICAFLGVCSSLLNLHDEKDIIRNSMPWNTCILLTGTTFLVTIAGNAGVTELVSNWASSSVPAGAVAPLFAGLAGFLSIFSGATAVVMPLLYPMIAAVSQASGVTATWLASSILTASNCAAISPFSTGGALLLGGCYDESLRDNLFIQLIAYSVGSIVISVIIAALHIGVVGTI